MVSRKFQLIVILLLYITFNSISFASAQLILSINKTESELGRPIRAELYAISIKSKITEVKLDKLYTNFGVITDYVINDTRDDRWPNKKIQILKFKLYPRSTGLIEIPSLTIDNISSKKQSITISYGNIEKPELNISSASPYQRQQVIVKFSVISSEANSRLAIKGEHETQNMDSTPLHFKRSKNNNGTYRLQIGWALSALTSGILKLDFPPIEYSVSGVSRKQFYLPIREIHVKPLPSYLPPTVPVGKIAIKSNLIEKYFLKTGSLSYWDIKISGQLNSTYALPPILRQIKSNNKVQFLPANVVRSVKSSEDHVVSTAHYSIPFKPLHSGALTLPTIQLQYFDPNNGKIISFNHQIKNILVLSVFWQSMIVIFIATLLIFISIKGRKHWLRLKISNQKRLQAIKLLQENNNIENIREAIQLVAESEYWPINITITKWSKLWQEKYKVDTDFSELMNKISSLLYATEQNNNVKQLSQQMLALVLNKSKR